MKKGVSKAEISAWLEAFGVRSQNVMDELRRGGVDINQPFNGRTFLMDQKILSQDLDKLIAIGSTKADFYPESTRTLIKTLDYDLGNLEHRLGLPNNWVK